MLKSFRKLQKKFSKNTVMILAIILLIMVILFIKFYGSKKENFALKNSYSQINQDLNVLKYLNYKKNGYFVEVGAANGINLSNTYLLEKKYGWNGICIEPVPSHFKELVKNRDCIKLNIAAYNKSGEEVEIAEAGLLSGIKNDIDRHKKAKEGNTFKIKTKTLTEILDENNAPNTIDYMSLDTEGSELKILQGIDFNKYKFRYINLEHNFVEPRRRQMRKLLEDNGYKYKGQNEFDDDYVLL